VNFFTCGVLGMGGSSLWRKAVMLCALVSQKDEPASPQTNIRGLVPTDRPRARPIVL